MILSYDFTIQSKDRGLLNGAVFAYLRKAYDALDHWRVLSKLLLCCIDREDMKWFWTLPGVPENGNIFDKGQR